jgi:hypothetical protein
MEVSFYGLHNIQYRQKRSIVTDPDILTSVLNGSEWSALRHSRFDTHEKLVGARRVKSLLAPNWTLSR